MPDCERRNQLVRELRDALEKFSHSINQLRASVGDVNFAQQLQATELARLHADNARTILELHRSEHGC
jgi:hypothetical protein